MTAASCAPDEHRIILGAKRSPMGRWATSAYRDAIETVESHRGLVRTVIANRFRFLCREHHLSMPRRAIVLRMLSAKIAPNRLGLKKIAIYIINLPSWTSRERRFHKDFSIIERVGVNGTCE